MELPQYWQAIQQKICPRCLDGDGNGNCRLPIGDECALKSFLSQIVITMANTKSQSIETCINGLRRNVCILWDHQNADTTCKKRNDLECALDRYYPLVVEVIEIVRAEMARADLNTAD